MTIDVPQAPALATVPNVELMHTGQWPISTGTFTFTTGDLSSAVAALDCPAVRRPVLKLGHAEPDPDEHGIRWDGEPAVGYVANMAVAEAGRTLVGDYTGMPGWLGDVIASAYPDRSIEGQYDFRCQMGHCHPFVVTAVALLGVTAPGIGTLQSLQDVAALYGVAAAAPEPQGQATPFTLTIHAAREDSVPNPHPAQVAASVTTEDVRRAFYTSEYGKSWDIWIEEMQLGADTQLIVMDDASGTRSRVPVTLGDGDGEDAVSFSEPVKVVVRYEDAPGVAAAAEGSRRVRYASRAESRPGQAPTPAGKPETPQEAINRIAKASGLTDTADEADTQTPPAEPDGETQKEGDPMALDKGLRERLGLADDADDEAVLAAVDALRETKPADENTDPAPEPETELVAAGGPKLPDGVALMDKTELDELRAAAADGRAAREQQRTEARDRALDEAVQAGKFAPARRDHWARLYDADPDGTKTTLASLEAGLVPLVDQGAPGGEETTESFDAEFDRMFPPHTIAKG